jgi:hypothetical protein
VPPEQILTELGELTVGKAFTVKAVFAVLVQLKEFAYVYVMVVDPELRAEINPVVGLIVAIDGLDEDQEPPACEFDKEVEVFTHVALLPELGARTDAGFTVTIKVDGNPTHDPKVDVGVIE